MYIYIYIYVVCVCLCVYICLYIYIYTYAHIHISHTYRYSYIMPKAGKWDQALTTLEQARQSKRGCPLRLPSARSLFLSMLEGKPPSSPPRLPRPG